jgi:hypothetical protein
MNEKEWIVVLGGGRLAVWVTDEREGRNREKENKEKKRDVEQASLLACLLEGDMDRQTLPWNRQGGRPAFH